MRKLMVGALAALVLAACDTIDKPPHLTGQWGGEHVGLVLEGGIGTLEYDCASGTIDTIVVPGPDGRFTASGTHRPGQGGPVRVGQIFTAHRATYSGTVVKDEMTLSVKVEDGPTLGPFTLRLGAEPRITRCL